MSTDKDSRLVDYLYDELSEEETEAFERTRESDAALSSELAGLEETLETLRTVEAEEPSLHLDSLILANARQAADELAEEEKKKGLRGWLRKMVASPLAGLVTAASVAVVAALVTVPAMMMSSSEVAPTSVEQAAAELERIPTPVEEPADPLVRPSDQPVATPEPAPDSETRENRLAAERAQAPKKKRRAEPTKPARKPAQDPEAKADPKPVPKVAAAPRGGEDRARTTLRYGDDLDERLEAKKDSGGVGSGPAPATLRPAAPPAPSAVEAPPAESRAVVREGRAVSKKSESMVKEEEAEAPAATGEALRDDFSAREADLAAREEKGRAMLRAASEEFKRGNPDGGRRILVRALSEAKDAPIHAEIAFRLAQHDFDRTAYAEAIVYARIAASAPKFDKRKAALDLLVLAEKKLAEERSRPMDDLAPATNEADEAR